MRGVGEVERINMAEGVGDVDGGDDVTPEKEAAAAAVVP